MLIEIIDNIKHEKNETLKYQEQMKMYKKFVKAKSIDELTPFEIIQLELNNFEPPNEPRYPFGCVVFLILDDLIGSSAFKSVGKSALTSLVLRNRHVGVNIIIATQSLKSIPKPLRMNTSVFVIFRFASRKIVCEDLWIEVSNLLSIEQFEKLYDFATSEPHNALVLDFTAKKGEQIRKNFNTILSIDN
jgi:hypothetical protein